MEAWKGDLPPTLRLMADLSELVEAVEWFDRFPTVGYNLRLRTGWTISVRMGPGTYSEYRWAIDDIMVPEDDAETRARLTDTWKRSATAEIAAFDAEGWWWDWSAAKSVRSSTDGDTILGYQDTHDLMVAVLALPDLRPPGLTGGHRGR